MRYTRVKALGCCGVGSQDGRGVRRGLWRLCAAVAARVGGADAVHRAQVAGGKWPESIALVLWGTDNIKTYGESLAQVLWMVGIKAVPDALGRVNKLEVRLETEARRGVESRALCCAHSSPICWRITPLAPQHANSSALASNPRLLQVVSLEELGRPRIDVVVNCSGVFRDLFVNQMNLLDRAVKMAAELDEPLEMNFVRKHALEQVGGGLAGGPGDVSEREGDGTSV